MKKPQHTINVLSSKDQGFKDKVNSLLILGLDAEILVRKAGKIVWPHTVGCPQSRDESDWVASSVLGTPLFDWHGDGYAFEVCTKPTHCINNLLRSVGQSMGYLETRMKSPLVLSAPTMYVVPNKIAARAPSEVRQLGCAVSFNVYDDDGDPSSLGDTDRTTGCHLHVSNKWLTNPNAKLSVKWADIVVGTAWTYISPEESDVEQERRKAYGRAGEHRRNVYPDGTCGFEYRVLPGRALSHPSYLSLMFNLVRSAVHLAYKQGEPDKFVSVAARTAINKADKVMAKAILDTLPFTPESRQVLDYMASTPLPVLSAKQWAKAGSTGHMESWWNRSVKKGAA